jgi:hypothetical protein
MRVVAALAVLLGAAPARADDGAEPRLIPKQSPAAAAANRDLSHQGQLAISIRLPLGLRALAPYDDGYCGQTDPGGSNGFAAVCTGRAPFSIDFEVGYGLARRIDVFLELRLGIEQDFGRTPADQDGARVFHVSPGARFFFSDAGRSKLFTTAQLVIDGSGYKDLAGQGRGADVGLRNLSGIWFDLDRAYGIYAFVGETATFARWLRFELEAGIGVQGRYR